jgi:putative transposase
MKARKYTEEQIIAVLKEGEAGARVADLCRKYGMSDATYYNWKAKYAGMTFSDLKRFEIPGSGKPASQADCSRPGPG